VHAQVVPFPSNASIPRSWPGRSLPSRTINPAAPGEFTERPFTSLSQTANAIGFYANPMSHPAFNPFLSPTQRERLFNRDAAAFYFSQARAIQQQEAAMDRASRTFPDGSAVRYTSRRSAALPLTPSGSAYPGARAGAYFDRITPRHTTNEDTGYYERPNRYFQNNGYQR
jgi:hypothetical protein